MLVFGLVHVLLALFVHDVFEVAYFYLDWVLRLNAGATGAEVEAGPALVSDAVDLYGFVVDLLECLIKLMIDTHRAFYRRIIHLLI